MVGWWKEAWLKKIAWQKKMVGWLVGWLVDWLFDWLFDWLVDWCSSWFVSPRLRFFAQIRHVHLLGADGEVLSRGLAAVLKQRAERGTLVKWFVSKNDEKTCKCQPNGYDYVNPVDLCWWNMMKWCLNMTMLSKWNNNILETDDDPAVDLCWWHYNILLTYEWHTNDIQMKQNFTKKKTRKVGAT